MVTSDSALSRSNSRQLHTKNYLKSIGVPMVTPATSLFDPGYDLFTPKGHLEQSHNIMSILEISMATWMIVDEKIVRQKIGEAKKCRVPTTTGGGPFEVAYMQGKLYEYLDLVADFGFTRIECGEGFTDVSSSASSV